MTMADFDPPESTDDAVLERALRTHHAGDPPGLAHTIAAASRGDRQRAAQRLRDAERQGRPPRHVLATAALVVLGVGAAVFAAMRTGSRSTQEQPSNTGIQDPLPALELETEPVESESWAQVTQRLDDVAEIHLQAAWLRRDKNAAAVHIEVSGLSGFRERIHTEDRAALVDRIRAAQPGDDRAGISSFSKTYWMEFHLTSGAWLRAAAWPGGDGLTVLAFDNAGQIGVELPPSVARQVGALELRIASAFAELSADDDLEDVPPTVEILVCRDQRAVDLADRLADLPRLRELILEGTSPTPELIEQIGACSRLTSIEVQAPALELASRVDLEPLQALPGLRSLDLTGLRLDPTQLAALAALRELSLTACALDAGGGLDAIGAIALQRLALVDPVGLEPASLDALARLADLRHLELGLPSAEAGTTAMTAIRGLRRLERCELRLPAGAEKPSVPPELAQRGVEIEILTR